MIPDLPSYSRFSRTKIPGSGEFSTRTRVGLFLLAEGFSGLAITRLVLRRINRISPDFSHFDPHALSPLPDLSLTATTHAQGNSRTYFCMLLM